MLIIEMKMYFFGIIILLYTICSYGSDRVEKYKKH